VIKKAPDQPLQRNALVIAIRDFDVATTSRFVNCAKQEPSSARTRRIRLNSSRSGPPPRKLDLALVDFIINKVHLDAAIGLERVELLSRADEAMAS
jgi:hypothetical protein